MNNKLEYRSTSKLSVKESFDDDDMSDDVEDEVFIRDGKKGFKLDDEIGVKRPLMAPRRKFNYKQLNSDRLKRPLYKRICSSYGYGLSFLTIFLGLSLAAIIILSVVPNPFDKFRRWKMEPIPYPVIVPCTEFKTENIWHQSFPFLKTEAAIVTFDSNGDTFLDIVIGFSTGVQENEMVEKCSLFEGSAGKCGGGVMALDGRNGAVLWKYWTRKDVLFIECSHNINDEKTPDCLLSGKGGVLCVVDGKSGSLIWEFSKSPNKHRIDLYSAQYIFDLNDDGFAEVLISHTSDKSSHLVILNGKNGKEIGQIESPDKKSMFTVPRVIHTRNNTYNVVFSTGSLDSPGSLFIIPLESIALSDTNKCKNIWSGTLGVSSGILLADMNNDGSLDIIFTSGHTVIGISGSNNSRLFNITSVESSPSQILVGPTPAYFDDDGVPDLLIQEMVGPSFPTYYYSKNWVASGATGKPLLNDDILGSSRVNAPGIALSFSGFGNDMFLYWVTTCSVSPDLQKQPFSFSPDTSLHAQTHADLCRLRFNTTTETRLYMLNQHIEPPGVLIYSSTNSWDIEHNNSDTWSKSQPTVKYSSNFRQRGQTYYQFSPETNEKKSSFGNYHHYGSDGRFDRSRWESPQVAYEERISALNLGEPFYPEESRENVAIPEDGRDERANYGKEMKREARRWRRSVQRYHSVPKATSTAALANGVNGSGVDLIFATFWELSPSNVHIFNEKQRKCIEEKLAVEQTSNNLNSLELEMAEETAERDCGARGDEDRDEREGKAEGGGAGGRLTVFRLRLYPSCRDLRPGEECSLLLPLAQQSYPRRGSDIFFKSRQLPLQQFITA